MADSEKIKGAGITSIFEALLQDKTLLKMNLLGTDYQHLTLINALNPRKKGPYFIIDPPEGFKEAAADVDTWQIRFEFTGKDKIKYGFTTMGGEIADNQIYVKMPQEVVRKQRRKLFRIHAPAGTKICFSMHGFQHELRVIDISLGGSLAALVHTEKHFFESSQFSHTRILKDIELVFLPRFSCRPIKINTTQIKRMAKNRYTKRYEMALEFSKMSKNDEKRLTALIYRLQRQYLRKRLPVEI